jgi:acyl-coenzyme A thioesterase PaaI-like protein
MANLAPPSMPESWSTRIIRWGFNLAPVYRGTGAWVTHISADWRDVRIKLPLTLRTRNYVGTIFGGSMYAAVDPFYMIMLMRNLGKGYIVWDKAATIRFRKPGKKTLYARFALDEAELSAIRAELANSRSLDRTYTVTLTDAQGTVHAEIEKVIYIRRNASATGEAEREASDAMASAPRSERAL